MSKLGIRTALSNIPLIGDICFLLIIFEMINLKCMNRYQSFFLTVDKFMPELHRRQLGFTYALVDRSLNIVKGLKNLKKQVI